MKKKRRKKVETHRHPFKFFKVTHLQVGPRKKVYSIRGAIHLFNKHVLRNYYVSRVRERLEIQEEKYRGAPGIE